MTYTTANVLSSAEFMKIVMSEVFNSLAISKGVNAEEVETAFNSGAKNVVKAVTEHVLVAAQGYADKLNSEQA